MHRALSVSLFSCLAVTTPLPEADLRADDLTQRIEQAADGAILEIPAGTTTSPQSIRRPLTLRGQDPATSIVDVNSNQPVLSVTGADPVVIEGLTFRWQLATSDAGEQPPCAVFVKDANVTLRDCRFVAAGNPKRSPSALLCTGFSHVKVEGCHFEGFEFTIGVDSGAEATIADSVVLNPGHCGISVYSGSKVEVARTIVTGSEFHGLRSTGGTLDVHDCLIIRNANRGVYLGNKSAHGRIRNNVLLGNGTGISGFAQSNVTIDHNVFAENRYSGLDARDTCPLEVHHNTFAGNTRGFVLFAESGRNDMKLGPNCYWENETTTENIETPADALLENPRFAQQDAGDFTTTLGEPSTGGFGLIDPAPIRELWKSWTQIAPEVD